MTDTIHLFRSDSQESVLASCLLTQHQIPFEEVKANDSLVDEELSRTYYSPMFAGSTGESIVPALFTLDDPSPALPRESYLSFSGVRAFVRRRLASSLSLTPIPAVTSAEAFYRDANTVLCINEAGRRQFVGPIDQAPHTIQPLLDLHDFQSWHSVSSRNIGRFNSLFRRKGDLYVNQGLGLLFFPYERELLANGKPVVTSDSRSEMHVEYTVYHAHEGNLFRIDAEMTD